MDNLTIDFEAKSDGYLKIFFETYITNQPLGDVIFKIWLDSDEIFTSNTYSGGPSDGEYTNESLDENIKEDDHTIKVTVYGTEATSGIYDAMLIVSFSRYI